MISRFIFVAWAGLLLCGLSVSADQGEIVT
jgi:hypothetical protein